MSSPSGHHPQTPSQASNATWDEYCARLTERLNALASASSSASLLSAGEELGDFVVHERIGRGGMGEVYRATQKMLDREVALKVIRPQLSVSPESRRRFLTEIRSLGKLPRDQGGEHVVHAITAGDEGGVLYFAMEFVRGRSLAERLRDLESQGRRLPIAAVCDYMRQAALGIACAHAQGIVHRDIKPSNLMVDDIGRVFVLDLGIARLLDQDDDVAQGARAAMTPAVRAALEQSGEGDWTRTNQFLGTPAYAAPEQLERGGEINASTDVYGLGATLFAALTGQAPQPEQADPRVVRRDVPRPLADLVARMLARDPAARIASARDVARELQRMPGRIRRDAARRAVMKLALAGACLLGVWALVHWMPDPRSWFPERVAAPPPAASANDAELETRLARDFHAGPVFFRDSFEKGDPEAWNTLMKGQGVRIGGYFNYLGPNPPVELVQTPLARTGKQALQITFTKTGEEARGELVIAEGADRLRVTQHLRFSEEYDFSRSQQILRLTCWNDETERSRYDIKLGLIGAPLPGSETNDMGGRNDSHDIQFSYGGEEGEWAGEEHPPFKLQRGRWYRVDLEVALNKPGEADGVVRALVDGRVVAKKSGVRMRDAWDKRIGRVLFCGNVYSGGEAHPSSNPEAGSVLLLDDIAIAGDQDGR